MSFWPIGCFTNHKVLVTGGTSGIGAAIAQAFCSEGARVTATGITLSEIDALCAKSPRINGVVLDVRDNEAVNELLESMGSLDHLVNCAGTIRRGDELNPEVFDEVIDVNLAGSMRVCAAARSKLAERNGTILSTASMLSYFGGGLVPGYAASKGGVVQMTKSLAIAYADDGIRVNAVAPGWINTPLTEALQQNKTRNAALLSRTPLNRWGQPQDLAGAALFLASPLASFITGTVLNVDGGYSVA